MYNRKGLEAKVQLLEKIGMLKSIIERSTELGTRVLNERHKKVKFSYYEYLMIVFLERYVYNSLGIKKLIDLYETNPNFILPISIILRGALLDFISQCYLLSGIDNEKEAQPEYEKRVENLLCSGLLKEIKSIEKRRKEKQITQNEFLQQMNIGYNRYSMYFDEFDKATGIYKLKASKEVSTIKMFRKFMENESFKLYAPAYELYDFYSKIEHIGAFTYDIQKFHTRDYLLHFERVIHSTLFICRGMRFSFIKVEIPQKEKFIEEFDKIGLDFFGIKEQ